MKSLTKTVRLSWLVRRWWFWLLMVFVVAFVIVHAYLAVWVRDYVNRKLSEIHGYRAHIAAVTLHLWRGAYQIHNLDIKKTSGDVPVPFFSAPLIDFNVQWKALIFERSMVGEIQIYRPNMNLVNGPSVSERQAPVDEPWAQKIKQLYPLKINRFTIHDGEIYYRDFNKTPKVNITVDQIEMIASNLTNSKKLSKTLIAEVEIKGRPLQAGHGRVQMALDPYAANPTFSLNVELKEIPLVKLNDFAKAYGNFTFEKGTFRMAMEASASKGAYQGYVEPVFDHMSIFNPEHDAENPLSFVWQAIVGGITHIVRNQPKDRFGTKVPFAGTFDNPQPDIIETVFNAFRNAFVKAFSGTLENKDVELPELEKQKKE